MALARPHGMRHTANDFHLAHLDVCPGSDACVDPRYVPLTPEQETHLTAAIDQARQQWLDGIAFEELDLSAWSEEAVEEESLTALVLGYGGPFYASV